MTAGREFVWVRLQSVFKQMIIFLSKKYPQAYVEKDILVLRGWEKNEKPVHSLHKAKKLHIW